MSGRPSTAPHARVRLHPFSEDDLPFLYQLELQAGALRPWRYRHRMPPPEAYLEMLTSGADCLMVASSVEVGEPFGAYLAYDADLLAGTMWIAASTARPCHGSGLPMQGLTTFIDHCFTTWDLRSVLFQAGEAQTSATGASFERIGTECGRYRAHDCVDGTALDRVVRSLSRKQWDQVPPHAKGQVRSNAEDRPDAAVPTPAEFCDALARAVGRQPGSVSIDDRFDADLGLDSLDRFAVLLLMEELSGWQVPNALVESLATVDDAHAYVDTRLTASGRGPE